MSDLSASPEQLPSVEHVERQPDTLPGHSDVLEKLKHRSAQLEKLKEGKKKSTGTHDDEDQQQALQAARASRKTGRMMTVMDGKVIDLNLVTGHFFTKQTKRVTAVMKQDLHRAVEWWRGLREAFQKWEEGGKGTSLPVLLFVFVMFWKV